MTQFTTADNQILAEVMKRCGTHCTIAEFQSSVNVTFHNFESEVYDQIHANMWRSLPREFNLLVDDCLKDPPELPARMSVLDVGAGTGLGSYCLLGTALGNRIASVDLLDTSTAMLEQAVRRSSNWKIPVTSRVGLLADVPRDRTYDVILTCSVLHHVPDLQEFCSLVRSHQKPGGIFLHLQDPNPLVLDKARYDEDRQNSFGARLGTQLRRLTPKRIWGRLRRQVSGEQNHDYVWKTNHALLKQGVISNPLSVADLYSITDLHIMNGHGISVEAMQVWLPNYERVSYRTYGFFGQLWSDLPGNLRSQEEQLSRDNALNGIHVAAAWRLSS